MRRWQTMGMSPGAYMARGLTRRRGLVRQGGYAGEEGDMHESWVRYSTQMLGKRAEWPGTKLPESKVCACECGQSGNDETVMVSSQATTEPLDSQQSHDSELESDDLISSSGTEESCYTETDEDDGVKHPQEQQEHQQHTDQVEHSEVQNCQDQ